MNSSQSIGSNDLQKHQSQRFGTGNMQSVPQIAEPVLEDDCTAKDPFIIKQQKLESKYQALQSQMQEQAQSESARSSILQFDPSKGAIAVKDIASLQHQIGPYGEIILDRQSQSDEESYDEESFSSGRDYQTFDQKVGSGQIIGAATIAVERLDLKSDLIEKQTKLPPQSKAAQIGFLNIDKATESEKQKRIGVTESAFFGRTRAQPKRDDLPDSQLAPNQDNTAMLSIANFDTYGQGQSNHGAQNSYNSSQQKQSRNSKKSEVIDDQSILAFNNKAYWQERQSEDSQQKFKKEWARSSLNSGRSEPMQSEPIQITARKESLGNKIIMWEQQDSENNGCLGGSQNAFINNEPKILSKIHVPTAVSNNENVRFTGMKGEANISQSNYSEGPNSQCDNQKVVSDSVDYLNQPLYFSQQIIGPSSEVAAQLNDQKQIIDNYDPQNIEASGRSNVQLSQNQREISVLGSIKSSNEPVMFNQEFDQRSSDNDKEIDQNDINQLSFKADDLGLHKDSQEQKSSLYVQSVGSSTPIASIAVAQTQSFGKYHQMSTFVNRKIDVEDDIQRFWPSDVLQSEQVQIEQEDEQEGQQQDSFINMTRQNESLERNLNMMAEKSAQLRMAKSLNEPQNLRFQNVQNSLIVQNQGTKQNYRNDCIISKILKDVSNPQKAIDQSLKTMREAQQNIMLSLNTIKTSKPGQISSLQNYYSGVDNSFDGREKAQSLVFPSKAQTIQLSPTIANQVQTLNEKQFLNHQEIDYIDHREKEKDNYPLLEKKILKLSNYNDPQIHKNSPIASSKSQNNFNKFNNQMYFLQENNQSISPSKHQKFQNDSCLALLKKTSASMKNTKDYSQSKPVCISNDISLEKNNDKSIKNDVVQYCKRSQHQRYIIGKLYKQAKSQTRQKENNQIQNLISKVDKKLEQGSEQFNSQIEKHPLVIKSFESQQDNQKFENDIRISKEEENSFNKSFTNNNSSEKQVIENTVQNKIRTTKLNRYKEIERQILQKRMCQEDLDQKNLEQQIQIQQIPYENLNLASEEIRNKQFVQETQQIMRRFQQENQIQGFNFENQEKINSEVSKQEKFKNQNEIQQNQQYDNQINNFLPDHVIDNSEIIYQNDSRIALNKDRNNKSVHQVSDLTLRDLKCYSNRSSINPISPNENISLQQDSKMHQVQQMNNAIDQKLIMNHQYIKQVTDQLNSQRSRQDFIKLQKIQQIEENIDIIEYNQQSNNEFIEIIPNQSQFLNKRMNFQNNDFDPFKINKFQQNQHMPSQINYESRLRNSNSQIKIKEFRNQILTSNSSQNNRNSKRNQFDQQENEVDYLVRNRLLRDYYESLNRVQGIDFSSQKIKQTPQVFQDKIQIRASKNRFPCNNDQAPTSLPKETGFKSRFGKRQKEIEGQINKVTPDQTNSVLKNDFQARNEKIAQYQVNYFFEPADLYHQLNIKDNQLQVNVDKVKRIQFNKRAKSVDIQNFNQGKTLNKEVSVAIQKVNESIGNLPFAPFNKKRFNRKQDQVQLVENKDQHKVFQSRHQQLQNIQLEKNQYLTNNQQDSQQSQQSQYNATYSQTTIDQSNMHNSQLSSCRPSRSQKDKNIIDNLQNANSESLSKQLANEPIETLTINNRNKKQERVIQLDENENSIVKDKSNNDKSNDIQKLIDLQVRQAQMLIDLQCNYINGQQAAHQEKSQNDQNQSSQSNCIFQKSTLELIQKIFKQMENINTFILKSEQIESEKFAKLERNMNKLQKKYEKIKYQNQIKNSQSSKIFPFAKNKDQSFQSLTPEFDKKNLKKLDNETNSVSQVGKLNDNNVIKEIFSENNEQINEAGQIQIDETDKKFQQDLNEQVLIEGTIRLATDDEQTAIDVLNAPTPNSSDKNKSSQIITTIQQEMINLPQTLMPLKETKNKEIQTKDDDKMFSSDQIAEQVIKKLVEQDYLQGTLIQLTQALSEKEKLKLRLDRIKEKLTKAKNIRSEQTISDSTSGCWMIEKPRSFVQNLVSIESQFQENQANQLSQAFYITNLNGPKTDTYKNLNKSQLLDQNYIQKESKDYSQISSSLQQSSITLPHEASHKLIEAQNLNNQGIDIKSEVKKSNRQNDALESEENLGINSNQNRYVSNKQQLNFIQQRKENYESSPQQISGIYFRDTSDSMLEFDNNKVSSVKNIIDLQIQEQMQIQPVSDQQKVNDCDESKLNGKVKLRDFSKPFIPSQINKYISSNNENKVKLKDMANNLQKIQLNHNFILCPDHADQLNATTVKELTNSNLRHFSLSSKPDNHQKTQANVGITKQFEMQSEKSMELSICSYKSNLESINSKDDASIIKLDMYASGSLKFEENQEVHTNDIKNFNRGHVDVNSAFETKEFSAAFQSNDDSHQQQKIKEKQILN